MRQQSLPPRFDGLDPDTTNNAISMDIQDFHMSSDNESSNAYPVPAHLAARFWRPSAARRKTSGASSRRNSISSLHSNRSKRSAHGGPYSTHVAQHLRRASIIESRKARLADKAAHAEKVRLRAALAKAAPRMSAAREDRAMAAQQARERYLAQVAASCAEEVKRAKKVAEDMKERKAAEHLRMKENMEEKLAEAERRKRIYQQNLRRNRISTLPSVEERSAPIQKWTPKTDVAAARMIQGAWQNWRRRRAISDYLQIGLDVEQIKSSNFEDVSKLLGSENVLSATARVMQICELQDWEGGSGGDSTAVRVFLSTFLILGIPSSVLNADGEQEQDLIRKAKTLHLSFDLVLSNYQPGRKFSPSPVQLAALLESFNAFQTAMTAWKNRDASILIGTMVAQFAELDAIWQSVKNDTVGGVASDYNEGIRQNQTMLLVRLKRLAGHDKAMKLVREAVRARRKEQVERKAAKDTRPRETPSTFEVASDNEPSEDVLDSTTPSSSPQASELSRVISPMPRNQVVVHELAINKDWRIEIDPAVAETSAQRNQAVFQSMRADIQAGIGDRWILSMAKIIRNRLLQLLTAGNSLHVLISESLDQIVIENQVKAGNFSYEKFFSFVNTILPKLCSPSRDPDVKALAADRNPDFIARLAHTFRVLSLLYLDHANWLLFTASPRLIESAADYERKTFSDLYPTNHLPLTTTWWRLARIKLLTPSPSRRPSSSSPSPPNLTPEKIYTQALTDLFIAFPPSSTSTTTIPETLALDTARITLMRASVLRTITTSTILLTAKNLLKRDVRALWRAEAARMLALPAASAYTDASAYLSIIEAAHALPPSTKTALAGTIDRVLGEAAKPDEITHPVMKVLLAKARAYVAARLGAGSAEERVRGASAASEVLGSAGLGEFVATVGRWVEEMGAVRRVDLQAHGRWLDGVHADVVAEGAV